MTELQKTLVFVGVSLGLTGTAVLATWPRDRAAEAFSDQGQAFFPDFKDPAQATSLEVVDFDEATAEARAFKVMLKGSGKDARWVIPSHHDYPADAKDRLARTAAGVIDLKKDVIASDRPDQHEAMGVLDPSDRKTAALKGRGKRITLKNKDTVLADFIIGKEVVGRPGQRYVRVADPNQKRTYGVNVNVDLSTRFADWIETNLLKLDTSRVRRIIFDNHQVDPEAGTIKQGEVLTIERKDASSPWSMEGIAPGMELDTDKIATLTTALGDLKIVGVRPKPAGLTAALKAAEGQGISLTREARLSLQTRGFYLVNGRLLSNQGDVIVSTDEGIVYTLRFGEVTFASGDALSAGTEDSAATKEAQDPKKGEETVESRYLFVTASFDPALVPAPKAEAESPSELPPDVFALSADERAKKVKADQEKAEREKADYERKLAEGKKKAQELTDRFASWYYVVPGDAFRSVVLDRDALTRKPGERPASPPPSFPPGGAFPDGLPPGHP